MDSAVLGWRIMFSTVFGQCLLIVFFTFLLLMFVLKTTDRNMLKSFYLAVLSILSIFYLYIWALFWGTLNFIFNKFLILFLKNFLFWLKSILSPINKSFQAALVVKNPCAKKFKRRGFDPWVRKIHSPVGGYGNSPQYSCLENPMDRAAWRVGVHEVAKSQIKIKKVKGLTTHNRSLAGF